MKKNLKELGSIRQKIHKQPELSGKEKKTAAYIKEMILKSKPDEIIENIGGFGIAFTFKGTKPGKTVLLRCELDAIPVQENNKVKYCSVHQDISHACGHDGHMTIMTGVAEVLAKKRIKNGKVILLFQPSEETGEGAQRVLADPKFKKISPDYVFALHNLPGYEKNSIIINMNNFASASKGMEIKLFGKTAHAGEPENGSTPVFAVAQIIKELSLLGKNPFIKNYKNNTAKKYHDFTLITIIHTLLGSIAYGTTPGYAEIRATLRSYKNRDMGLLTQEALTIVKSTAKQEELKFKINWREEFPATVNNKDCINIIKKAALKGNLKIIKLTKPFKWSEDFGHFTQSFPGALFGLGAGKESAQLHNPNYNFPDEIIESGINIFYYILKEILEKKNV